MIKPAYFVNKEEVFDEKYLEKIREIEENNGLIRPALIVPAEFLFEKGKD